MTRLLEYIGVSGVVNQEQQAELEEIFAEYELTDRRVLQLGVKATHKPQFDRVENKYGREWYPVGREIDTALQYRESTQNVAQVCFDTDRVYDAIYREVFLWRALGNAASARYGWLNGIQFDMMPDWCEDPSTTQQTLSKGIYTLKNRVKELTVILQCQANIVNAHSPKDVVHALRTIDTDYVLFDASGGRGVRMNPDALLPYIEAVRNCPELNTLSVAVGGGLNADVVRTELPKLLRHFPDISWDAEGQLHPVNSDGKRPLDMSIVRDYLEASAEVLR